MRFSLLIFGIATGVPTLKALCNSDCPGSCSFDGFDLACNCQVPLNETNFQCGNITYCGDASNYVWNATTISRKCDCQTNFYDSSISCIVAACPQGYSGNSASTTCTDIDECESGICGYNASCLNTPGSFICECDVGYYLANGHICMNTSVLVLSTLDDEKNPPLVISFDGNYRKANFEYGFLTEVLESCSVEYQNQYYVFGGYNYGYRNQFSKINGCRLERQGFLPFRLWAGSCGNYNLGGHDIVLLCFGVSDQDSNLRTCHTFDGSEFTNLGIKSKYGHSGAYFSKYEGQPFIVSGMDDDLIDHVKTETLINGGTVNQAWSQLADYPFGSIFQYVSVSLQDRVIIFGSTSDLSSFQTIGVYKSGRWSSLGELKHRRDGYGAVEKNGMVMIVGGQTKIKWFDYSARTELWEVDDEQYDGQLAMPKLDDYWTPTTFLVDKDFCT